MIVYCGTCITIGDGLFVLRLYYDEIDAFVTTKLCGSKVSDITVSREFWITSNLKTHKIGCFMDNDFTT